jgi:ATP-binding cassette subfamily F protein 3
MIRLDNVSLAFGGQVVLDEVNWQTKENDRVALLGPNGAGKTTLLKLIMGEIHPDRGEVVVPKSAVLGHLPQERVVLEGNTVFREVRSILTEVLRIQERMRELEQSLARATQESPDYRSVLAEYGRLQERFEHLDGYQIESRVGEVLHGLGFSQADRDRPVEEFSGGWHMRIVLAKLLLQRPNVLLLDEPTNHLDLEARNWLEEYLKDYPGTVVLVSHDRYFLDRISHRITEVENGSLTDYYTQYAGYLEEKESRYDRLVAKAKRQEENIKRIRLFIDRSRSDKRRAAVVQSRIKMLEKMELITVPPRAKRIHFHFPDPPRSGRVVLELKNVRKNYGATEVFRDVDLVVERGERICLVGPNGAGKSTLMRIMAGLEPTSGGLVRTGHNVRSRFMDQEVTALLNPENVVLDELREAAPFDILPQVRTLLGAFLFSGDDVHKRVSVLSGGEKSRLALAKMLLEPSNVLLLDEPTNHLDIVSQDILLTALKRFPGTIVFVSHERYFIDQLARKIIEVQGGRLTVYLGNYEDYLDRKARDGAVPAPREKEPVRSTPKEEVERERSLRKETSRAEKKRQRGLEELERAIRKTEKRVEELEIVLSDPSLYNDGGKAREYATEYERLRVELGGLYERWVEMEGEN